MDNNLLLFRSVFDYSFDGIILEHIHRQTFHFNLNSKFYGNVSLFQEFNKLFCIMKSRHLFDCSQLIETKSNNKLQSLYKLCWFNLQVNLWIIAKPEMAITKSHWTRFNGIIRCFNGNRLHTILCYANPIKALIEQWKSERVGDGKNKN